MPTRKLVTARTDRRAEFEVRRADLAGEVAKLRAREIALTVRKVCDEFRECLAPELRWLDGVAGGFRSRALPVVGEIEATLTGPALASLVALADHGLDPVGVAAVSLRRRWQWFYEAHLRELLKQPKVLEKIDERIARYEQVATDLLDVDGFNAGTDQTLWLRPSGRASLDRLDAFLGIMYRTTFGALVPESEEPLARVGDFKGLALETATHGAMILLRGRAALLRDLREAHAPQQSRTPWLARPLGKGHRPRHLAEAAAGTDLLALNEPPTIKAARGRRDDAVARFLGNLFADTLDEPAWRSPKPGEAGKLLRNLLRRYPKPDAPTRPAPRSVRARGRR